MISSGLDAGFKFVSDSVIDLDFSSLTTWQPLHTSFCPPTNCGRGRLRVSGSPAQPTLPNSPISTWTELTPISPPITPVAPSTSPVPLTNDPLRGFDLRLTCDGIRSRPPRHGAYTAFQRHLVQPMPVSLGAFVCRMPAHYDHLKLAKTAWLPLSTHGVKDASYDKLNSSAGSLFPFSLILSVCSI